MELVTIVDVDRR